MLQRTIDLYKKSFGGLPREIWALSTVMLINRSGTMVLPFLTLYLTQTLDFTLIQAGYVMSFFGAGSLVGTYLGGRLTDRFGQYYVQIISLFFTGIAFLALIFLKTFWSVSIGIFIASTIADALRPANMSAIAVYSKPELHTRSIALNRFAINLGFSIGPAIGGLILANLGGDWLFIVDGVTCMAASIMFWLIIPRKEDEKTEREKNSDSKAKAKNTSESRTNGGSVFKDHLFIFFILCQLLIFMAFFQMFNSIPVYFKEILLLSEDQIGGLLAINGILIVAIEMPLIYKLEQSTNKLNLVNLGTFIIAIGFFLLITGTAWVGITVVFIVLLTLGEMVNFPFGHSYALARSNPENRGRYMAIYGMSFSVAVIVSPFIGMQIAEKFGFNTLWIFLGILGLISTAGVFWLNKMQEKEDQIKKREIQEV